MTTRPPQRGSVVLVVMWMLAIAALIVSAVQLFAYRQAMLGREVMARVQGRWAARGGMEYAIAIMADHTENPVAGNAFALIQDLEDVWTDDFEVGRSIIASYDIRHFLGNQQWKGPMDEHAKININAAAGDPTLLTPFEDMPPDVADAIRDWIDDDDEVSGQGVERDYYLSGSVPYEPRNGPMQSVAEHELVAGIWPEHLRGEDWNLNGRLDPNEDDGDRTWPDDVADGILDAAWSGWLTTHSVQGGRGPSGLPKIYLRDAEPEELEERLGVDEALANGILTFGQSQSSTMGQLLTAYVQQNFPQPPGGRQPTQPVANAPQLDLDQLRAVLAETTQDTPGRRLPGKINLNTVSEELLQKLFYGREHLADEILFLRNSRPEGITSLADLVEIPAFREDTATLEYLAGIADVSSNVYTISSKGRAYAGSVEVEIVAVVDRSTVPVRILEYREQ